MTPKTKESFTNLLRLILSVIACAALVWVVFEVEAHKDALKAENKALLYHNHYQNK